MAKKRSRKKEHTEVPTTTFKLYECISKVTITPEVSPTIATELLKFRDKIYAKTISKL